MKTKVFLSQYDKYCNAIANCNDNELLPNFKKFLDFIDARTDGELWRTLKVCAIDSAIEQVFARHLGFKELTNAWHYAVINDFFELADKVKEKKDEWLHSNYGSAQQPQNITVLEAKLVKLIADESDIATQLFMWKNYRNKLGRRLFEAELLELGRLKNLSENSVNS